MAPEVDSWRPSTSLEGLRARADLLRGIRAFFDRAGVLEVETPICSRHGTTDPAINSLQSRFTGPGFADGLLLNLHTSPEFAMKRLLAAGSGAIYQICKVFRDGESGRRHNPEFTMLEWYRPGFDHHQLIAEVAALLETLLPVAPPIEKLSYQQVFERTLGIDPHLASQEALVQCARDAGMGDVAGLAPDERDDWLDLLMSHLVEPALPAGMVFVYDYPASQASLARVRAGPPAVAERFELYLDGVEIANGFHELTDASEQRARFERDLQRRQQLGLPGIAMDQHLLDALNSGLPACAGVALGIDRLLMALLKVDHIEQVIAFPLDRA